MEKDFLYQLKLAQKFLSEGSEEKARQIAVFYLEKIPEDAELCFRWAKLCEELSLAKQAIQLYRKALKSDPSNPKILYSFSVLLNEIGYFEESIHYLKKLLKNNPNHTSARKLLSEIYRAIGLYGQADILYPLPEKPKPIRKFPPSVGKEHLERIRELFSGKEVGYSIQTFDKKTGDLSYEFINLPVSNKVILQHIKGDITLLVYPIRSDNTAKYTAIEVKVRSRLIKENLKNQGYLRYLEEKALSYALSVKKKSERFGIPSYVDTSGDFCFRIWFFFKEFVHFLKIREFLKRFLEKCPASESYLSVDPFIGTKGTGIGWEEHHIMLPFGINRATNKRALFLDEEGNPYPEQLSFLKKIQEISFKEAFDLLKSSFSFQTSEKRINGEVEKMLSMCPVLLEIAKKAKKGRILSREEKVILFYSVGILDKTGRSLHFILNPCPDYSYTKIERQRIRLKQNPISCIKIREMIPELTASVSCNCSFNLEGGKYPSPVMHVNPYLVPSKDDFDISEDLSFREIAKKFLNLKKQKAEIDQAIEKAKRILEKHYERTKKDKVKVGGFTVYRRKEGDWEIR